MLCVHTILLFLPLCSPLLCRNSSQGFHWCHSTCFLSFQSYMCSVDTLHNICLERKERYKVKGGG